MQAAGTRAVRTRQRYVMPVLIPPGVGSFVLGVDVEAVEDNSGAHSDQIAGTVSPKFFYVSRVSCGGIEAVRACWALISCAAWKYRIALGAQLQRVVNDSVRVAHQNCISDESSNGLPPPIACFSFVCSLAFTCGENGRTRTATCIFP